ncbi:MAG TPA: class IV adenylate cyclase [Thermoanaerobaculaceae bacterium]|nr:class IV adenylate cyclase [Thermoanaerobaculaceae bacterium]
MLEEEIKLPVGSLDPVRQRLIAQGAARLHPAALEDNWVLDDADRALARAGRLLRLRRFGAATILTLKQPARFRDGVKSREELETSLADPEAALAILAALGFFPARRYQKRRESWSFDGLKVALDDTPAGAFVEVEGEAAKLHPAARRLGLDPATAARGTYLDLWEAYRAVHPGAPADMVFGDADAR